MDTDQLEQLLRTVDAGDDIAVFSNIAHAADSEPPAFANPFLETLSKNAGKTYIARDLPGKLRAIHPITHDGKTRHIYEVKWGDQSAYYTREAFSEQVRLASNA
jgi:hypothetical protein